MEWKQDTSPKEILPIEKCQKCENGEPCPHGAKKPVSKSSTIAAWALGIVVLLFGLVMFGGITYETVRDHRLISQGTQTVGKVTSVDFGSCGTRKNRKTCAFPELTYIDQNGNEHFRQGPNITYREKEHGYKTVFADTLYGNEYTLYYDPSNPEKSVVEGQEGSYWILIFTLFPIAFGGFILYAMIDSEIRKRKAAKSQDS